MSDINQWNVNMDMINIAYNLAQWLIVAVAAICGVTLSVGTVSKAIRWAAHTIRPYVDEATDAAVMEIAKPLHLTPEQTADIIGKVLSAIDSSNTEEAVKTP